jgi:uncharacterized membrane protein
MFALSIMAIQIAWVVSIVITAISCGKKNLNTALWTILSVFFGPIILLIVLILPAQPASPTQDSKAQKQETLKNLKAEVSGLKNSLKLTQGKISKFEKDLELPASKKTRSLETKPKKSPDKKLQPTKNKEKSLELNLGRYWLSKIGSFIFVLGVAFLVTYSFKFFNAFSRIGLGYLASVSFLWLGFRLDKKKKFKNYGKTVLAAAWALLYFTTYAMHHFEASRILQSKIVDLSLLGLLVVGLIVYSLRYKSLGFTAFALFTGYFTAGLSEITSFTLVSCAILALAMVFLICRLKMTKLIYYGIFFTYLTHLVWITKRIDLSLIVTRTFSVQEVVFWLNSIFLFIYWLIFNLPIYYSKLHSTKEARSRLSLAGLFNFLFFFVLEYGWISKVYPEFKFNFVLGLGLVYLLFLGESRRLKNESLIKANCLISLSLLTLALPLKLSTNPTSLIWLVEGPIILYLGLVWKKGYLRVFTMLLAILLYFKYIFFTFGSQLTVNILGAHFLWKDILVSLSAVSTTSCYCFYRNRKINKIAKTKSVSASANLYSFLGTTYLVMLSWSLLEPKCLTSALVLVALGLFFIGLRVTDKYLRLYALMILGLTWLRMIFVDERFYYGILKWPFIGMQIAGSYLIYASSRFKTTLKLLFGYEKSWMGLVFVATTFILTVILFREVTAKWLSLALGLEGAVLFASGFLLGDKKFRTAGFIIFLLLLARILFIDIAGLDTIYRIISFIVIGLIFLVISFAYTKYKGLKSK